MTSPAALRRLAERRLDLVELRRLDPPHRLPQHDEEVVDFVRLGREAERFGFSVPAA